MPSRALALVLPLAVLLAGPALAAQLEGTVTGDAPLPGVRVTAWAQPFSWELDALTGVEARRRFATEAAGRVKVLARAQTGKDGRFILKGLPAGAVVSLWVDAGSRGQALLEAVTVGAEPALSVKLGKAYALDGSTLVRPAPGYPYPSDPRAGLAVVAVHARVPLLVSGTTNARGEFNLGSVPAGEYLVLGAGRGLVPTLERVTVPMPPKKSPEPSPVSVSVRDAGASEDPLEAAFGTQPRIPPRLGRADAAYQRGGLVLLSFVETTSISGGVTSQGLRVGHARLRLASGPGDVQMRTADAHGLFRFEEVASGTSYALEATDGTRTVRGCVAHRVEVGGSSCCSSSPALRVGDVSDGAFACVLRVQFDPPPGAQPSGARCDCDASVLDALSADAGR